MILIYNYLFRWKDSSKPHPKALRGCLGGITVMAAILALLSTPVYAAKKQKSTDFSFDELLIKGKHHFDNEIVTTVEQDKVLDALLSVRKDFRDRMKRSASRY